jgi:hypothetical protein
LPLLPSSVKSLQSLELKRHILFVYTLSLFFNNTVANMPKKIFTTSYFIDKKLIFFFFFLWDTKELHFDVLTRKAYYFTQCCLRNTLCKCTIPSPHAEKVAADSSYNFQCGNAFPLSDDGKGTSNIISYGKNTFLRMRKKVKKQPSMKKSTCIQQ